MLPVCCCFLCLSFAPICIHGLHALGQPHPLCAAYTLGDYPPKEKGKQHCYRLDSRDTHGSPKLPLWGQLPTPICCTLLLQSSAHAKQHRSALSADYHQQVDSACLGWQAQEAVSGVRPERAQARGRALLNLKLRDAEGGLLGRTLLTFILNKVPDRNATPIA